MAEPDYGVNITCLVDGCKITINPSYGFWRYLQDALSSTFPADSDAHDLAQAQMLRFYTEKLKEVSDGSVDYNTFISDIENSGYPFDNYILTQAQQQFENAQYNGFLNRIEAVFETGDGQAIQDFFDRYENSGIADNQLVIENSFSLMNPQNVLDRMILGDNDWGVTIQMCTSTVTTNCVDPKAINDIWEDFGRHIQVIFKGLEIPGLPEWLPLPGIMRLPTIGEIWDKVTGPFTDAAREQLRDCMSKDDDGDGVNNTASYCMENRDIIGIITKGLEDGAGEIIDATTDAVGGIVDKALEGVDCVLNPVYCAGKIKDVLEGVLGGADPTQPGLPPWMRAIIIGSQYGDEVLKELEKIFNEDIDGDGVIGIDTTQIECWDGSIVDDPDKCPPEPFDCTSIGKFDPPGGATSAQACEEPCEFDTSISSTDVNCVNPAPNGYCNDGTTPKDDEAGTNCEEYAPFGYCQDGVTKKEDSAGTNCEEYAPFGYCQDGVTKKEDSAGTNCEEYAEFGYCQDGTTKKEDAQGTNCEEYAEFGYCQDGTTKKEDSAGTNCEEYVPDYGMCDDGLTKKEDAEGTNCPGPEPVINEGDPCDLENGGQGTYQYVGDELQCLPEPPEFGFCQDGVTEKEDAEGTNCPEYAPFGYCQDNQTKKEDAEGTNCEEYAEFGYCADGVTKKEDAEGTNCEEYAEFGYCADGVTKKEDAEGTNCEENGTYDPVCTEPRPTGQLTFALEEQQFAWDQKCRATHCESGVPISEDPDCYGQQTCRNNAVNPDDCDDCGDGTTPDQHINGDCNEDLKNIDDTGGQCPADSERAGQNPIYDGRDTNKSGFFTTPNGITYTYEPCNPSLGFSIVGQDVNVCEDQNNLNYGNIVQQPEEPCGDCKPGFDKPDGYDTCTSIVDVLCKDDNVSGNYEECGGPEEPPEETNCAEQGKVTNDDGSCGDCDTEKGYVLSELTGRCYIPPDDDCPDDAEGNPQVRDGFDRCVPIGSECRAESFGGQDCRDPETNAYQFGVIDADGSCVCPGDIEVEACTDPNRNTNNDGSCADTCTDGSPAPESGLCPAPVEQCTDPNRNTNQDGSCADTCTDGSPAPESGLCPAPVEQCVTPDGTATGAIPPDCSECPTGQDFDTNGICVDIVLPETCNDPNAVNNGEDGPCECKPGFRKNAEGLCFQSGELCDNGATVESGCDTCPDGTSVIEYEDGICPSGSTDTCDNGATDFPACTTCPEGQSMDDSGNCVTTGEPPPETGGGGPSGGSLGGGGGMMTGISGYMGDPQLLSRTEFPITDFLAGLFSNLRGN